MSFLPRKCSNGHSNAPQAKYCRECGLLMDSNAAPTVQNNSWVRNPQDFAARVDAADLKGLLTRGIIVEPGTSAVLVDGGAVKGILPPGTHYLDSLDKRLFDWIQTGIGSQVSARLVSVQPTDLEFNAGGVFTKDPIGVGVRIKLNLEVSEPGKFLINVLGSRERYTVLELTGYLYPQVSMVVEKWIGKLTVQQLADDLSLREKLELALLEALTPTLAQAGIKFNFVRALEFNLEHLDKIKGVRSRYALQVAESEADLQGRENVFKVLRDGKVLEWAQETAKVEDEERRVELYERMRNAVLNGKISESRSEEQFEIFMNDLDYRKLLREKERGELLRAWKEDAEDKQNIRAHLLARMELECSYELRVAEFKLRTDMSTLELDEELRIERIRTDRQYQLQSEKLTFEIKQKRIEEEFRSEMEEKRRLQNLKRTEDDLRLRDQTHGRDIQDMLDKLKVAGAGFTVILDKREREKAIEWEDERRRMQAKWVIELEKIEIDVRREREVRQFELDRMKQLGQMGTDALIAASPLEQGRIIAELKKDERLKDMSEEQILALAAKDSPQVAQAFAEKFRAMSEGKASEREREMYDRLLGSERDKAMHISEQANRMTEEMRKSALELRMSAEREQVTARHAIEQIADVAKAYASNSSGTPLIINTSSGQVLQPSSSGGQVLNPSGSADHGQKACPECSMPLPLNAKFCLHCGFKFPGM